MGRCAFMIMGAGLLLVSGFTSTGAQAEMVWSTFSLSYLRGDHYQVGDDSRRVLTVEHASKHTWGDNFFFLDNLSSDDGTVKNYFELAPRLSLTYVTNKQMSVGIIKDLLIASTWESGDGFNNYLYGLGMALAVPGFRYFNINLYQVDNDLWDDDEQITLTWGLPFTLAGANFLFDGFLDYSTASDSNAREMNFTSQVKWDLGPLIGATAPFYVGMEYAYWNNKFGIDGVNERNPCLLVKWHF